MLSNLQLEPINMYSALVLLAVNLLDSSHFFILIRSVFISISTWVAVSPAVEIVVSSAYILAFEYLRQVKKSLI